MAAFSTRTGKTVARYTRAATPEALFIGQWQNRRSKLDDYKPYLHQRWTSGFTNVWALWKEITAQGYTGGYGAVSAYIRPMRTKPQPLRTRPPSARAVASWIATAPTTSPNNTAFSSRPCSLTARNCTR